MDPTEKKFWYLFFILNFLLFLPKYLIEIDTSTFFPYAGLLEGSIHDRLKFLFYRENFDPFRISIEFFILVLSLHAIRRYLSRTAGLVLLCFVYIILLTFQIYHYSFLKLYHTAPVLANDITMIGLGLSILLTDISLPTFLAFAGIVLALSLILFLLNKLSNCLWRMRFGTLSKIAIGSVALLSLVGIGGTGYGSKSARSAFQAQSINAVINVQKSLQIIGSLHRFDMDRFLASNDYTRYRLVDRPNIYLIFIESYGRILLDDPALSGDYGEYMAGYETILENHQFTSCSQLSTSPISGGKSWVSYATILYGYNFNDELVYNTVSKMPGIEDYNHLLKVLRQMGYTNYRLNSIYPSSLKSIPWEEYTRFYAIDRWIRFDDLHYSGKMYGFGPSPNDQYALNAAARSIEEAGREPFTLFFLTQNSHNPFYSPDQVASNWEDLNDGSFDPNTPSILVEKPALEDYARAIRFQLGFLTDYIVKRGTENDIFILIGDHQPILFPDPDDGFETPVHIVSRDSSFIRGFQRYGFEGGLLVKETSNPMKHEGFYSMFMRELIRNYGEKSAVLPEYRPEGITFE